MTTPPAKFAFAVALLFGALSSAIADSGLTLVESHQPKAVIVLADAPSPAATAGAKLMADMVFRISGAKLPVIHEADLQKPKAESDPSKGPYVLIGESELAKQLGATSEGLGPGGILIRTLPNALALLGADTKTPSDSGGSRYAVTTFLDEVLGCRYLWPGDSGLVIPPQDTVKVPALDRKFTPVIVERHIRANEYGERIQVGLDQLLLDKKAWDNARKITTPDWFVWQRMGGSLGLRAGDGSIIPREAWTRFLKEHPEWFAMQADGSREPAPGEERLRLCKSNPALIDAIVQEKLKELRANPKQSSVSLITHDGGRTGFCLCPACKALDPAEGRPTEIWTYDHQLSQVQKMQYVSLSDRMFWFNNQIAERVAREFPDVLFCGSAYSCYTAPPLHIKLHPHVVLRYAGMDYNSDTERQTGLTEWDGWVKAASMVQYRPNFLLAGRREGVPTIYVHKLAQDIRHMAERGLVSTDFDACMQNWSTQGLTYYVLAKLLWDPNLDVDAEIDSYCRSGFGNGWKEIENYFARLEALMNQTAAVNHAPGPDTPNGTIMIPYTPEVLAELRGYLDAADRATAGDAASQRRIAFLRRGLDLTEIEAAAHSFLRRAKELNADEKAEAVKLLDRRWVTMRKIFTEDHYAVNVAGLLQAEDHRFKPLGWKGPSTAARASVATVSAN
ncbi:uncharacterized protein DUF4838 [Chthoniobacter flavus]|uniref:DUF4838 domain-containing protein n=1 Tax=Chthoniobacter flavus TaxID=191863 RepID=UPI001047C5A7|nr:DUF4838 domain-containing protein [Chthoniobacter flavus]TCO87553.1 uncharacterized protein DUF4838 [Chthoniobacter flavus]